MFGGKSENDFASYIGWKFPGFVSEEIGVLFKTLLLYIKRESDTLALI